MNFPVLMLVMLLGSDGSVSKGVVPFENYESCFRSSKQVVDLNKYVWSDRVCVDARLFDQLNAHER